MTAKIALLSVALVDVWKGVGMATVIFIAGIMSIPEDYYEALMIDGGNAWHKFWNIILPLSRPAMNSVIILAFIGGLRSFDLIWAMTKGGPGFSTDLIASIIYKQYQAGFLWSVHSRKRNFIPTCFCIGIPTVCLFEQKKRWICNE
ncbi:hypothetical protein GCM10020331_087280 [Ectobacillus funiculus]